jgi:hypothetical protein
MSGFYQANTSYISKLTLKFLEDSGWYLPQYDLVSDLTYLKNDGCNYVTSNTC